MEILVTEGTLNQMNNMYQQILIKEKHLTRREHSLKAFLEGRKLTEDEIGRETELKAFLEERKLTQREVDFATDPNAVF